MRAERITDHPAFALMKQTDIQKNYYLQMPLWMFSDPRYSEISMDAKVTYMFLLNRFQLSRRKGWVNDQGEVFVVFPRLALAKELRICEKRVTAAFRELVLAKLIWEKRCGLGKANQIYLARVEPEDDPEYQCAPFLSPEKDNAVPEPQDRRFWNGGNGGSGIADLTAAEQPKLPSSKKEKSKNEESYYSVSPSVGESGDGQTDEEKLMGILDACELSLFRPEISMIFENAIERLFYSDCFQIGHATLPQSRVRAKLLRLDSMVLREAEQKLAANTEKSVRNSTAYVMATIFNCITEIESDIAVDPYLNSLRQKVPRHCRTDGG